MRLLITALACLLTVSLTAQELSIGDTYQGGIIFYLDDNGGGLIAAPYDQPYASWYAAADICSNLTIEVYNDWFLPSQDELYLMNLNKQSIGGFNTNSYWSSSESSSSHAWRQSFGSDEQNTRIKSAINYVRAARSFSPIVGCTDPTASNFNPNATEDDGGCIYTGCMDTTACNYNPEAIEDDGSCDYTCCPGPGCCDEGTYWNEETQTCLLDITYCSWQPDSNSDGLIGIGDLLDLLSVFGDTDYDEDGVFDSVDDCLDLEACNYAANPTEPCGFIDALGECGGGCEADTDGDDICDDIDDCIGVIDECGVCNGPGATEVVIESITLLYDSVYAPEIDFWFVYETGADTAFSYECPNVFQSCGDLVSHDGYDYSTVQIGEQCWFSENCRYLPEVSHPSEGSDTDPYYYVFDYQGTDVEEAQATANYDTYGVLYNWPAVMSDEICPTSWHIPSDGEWQTMEMSLGMSELEASSTGWRGTDEGYLMKSTSGWDDGGNGSNSSGFLAIPGGYCDAWDGYFGQNGESCYFWTPSDNVARWLIDYQSSVYSSSSFTKYNGFSARCLKD